jgi:hypothetical protein
MNRPAPQPTDKREIRRTAPRVAYLVPLRGTENSPRFNGGEPQEIGTFSTAMHPWFEGVKFNTRSSATRLVAAWTGFGGEIVRLVRRARFQTKHCSSSHLLIAYEGMARQQGESILDGADRPAPRGLTQKLTFEPPGRRLPDLSGGARPML